MKLKLGELKKLIEALVEGTIEVSPRGLRPGDVLNGRLIAHVTVDQKNKGYVFVTYDDGSSVRLRAHNLKYKQVPRIERSGTESDKYLPKIPAGWGSKG